eukprot:GHVN01098888.1.p1 GENE.GHVN01098888.1~~GHVN01098888.1.p1  ORF type:complete len:283 (-),score=19.33 GHVN01098888.1:40-888(-)
MVWNWSSVVCLLVSCSPCFAVWGQSTPRPKDPLKHDSSPVPLKNPKNTVYIPTQIPPPPSNLSLFQQEAYVEHNRRRQCAGLSIVRWDKGLAEAAQNWLAYQINKSCDLTHSYGRDRSSISEFRYAGENLYKRTGDGRINGTEMVQAFWREIKCYMYGPFNSTSNVIDSPECKGAMIGHFTQVMWSSLSAIGCDALSCPDEGQSDIGVCWYGEGGNIRNQPPFSKLSWNLQAEDYFKADECYGKQWRQEIFDIDLPDSDSKVRPKTHPTFYLTLLCFALSVF